MIFHRHSLARVVQQQRENQQVAALLHFPYGSELRSSRVGRLRQCLQVFNRAQRVFVHGIAMIKITHHQRIDRAQLRQDFHQYTQSMHGSQRHAGIVRCKNFFERLPAHHLISRRQFRMRYHVVNGTFGIAAQHRSGPRRLREKRIDNGTVSQRGLIKNFKLSAANREMRAAR